MIKNKVCCVPASYTSVFNNPQGGRLQNKVCCAAPVCDSVFKKNNEPETTAYPILLTLVNCTYTGVRFISYPNGVANGTVIPNIISSNLDPGSSGGSVGFGNTKARCILPDTIDVVGATSEYNSSTGRIRLSNPTGVVRVSVTCFDYPPAHLVATYDHVNKTMTIVGYSGTSETLPTDVYINSRYYYNDGTNEGIYTVKRINTEAFKGYSTMESVFIPPTVESIGSGAFSGCSSLVNMTIPFVGGNLNAREASRSTLFGYIFGETSYEGGINTTQYYSETDSVVYCIPASLRSVTVTGGRLFYGAFSGCSWLTSISIAIAAGVSSIGKRAFQGCAGLTSIDIPSGVETIEDGAFENCTGLTSVNLPEGVVSIGDQAFSNCTSLPSISLPSSVTEIGESAFDGCDSLTSVDLSESITYVGDYAFEGCSWLSSVVIPDGVTHIGEGAFRNCSGIITLTLPATLVSIGQFAFYGCSSLAAIDYAGNISDWLSIDSLENLMPYSTGKTFYINGIKLDNLVIPEGTTAIPAYSFYGFKSVRTVTIPNSVISVGARAFAYCEGIPTITLLGMSSIADGAFYNCLSLSTVTLGFQLNHYSISDYLFYGCTSLSFILFDGTIRNWIDTPKGINWDMNSAPYVVRCTDGDAAYRIVCSIPNGASSGPAQINVQSYVPTDITIIPSSGYSLPPRIKVREHTGTGGAYSDITYSYNQSTGVVSLTNANFPYSWVDQSLPSLGIWATCHPTAGYLVTNSVLNGTISGPTGWNGRIPGDSDTPLVLTVVPDSNYQLPLSITVVGSVNFEYDSSTGEISLANAYSDIEISVECVEVSSGYTVTFDFGVNEYVSQLTSIVIECLCKDDITRRYEFSTPGNWVYPATFVDTDSPGEPLLTYPYPSLFDWHNGAYSLNNVLEIVFLYQPSSGGGVFKGSYSSMTDAVYSGEEVDIGSGIVLESDETFAVILEFD